VSIEQCKVFFKRCSVSRVKKTVIMKANLMTHLGYGSDYFGMSGVKRIVREVQADKVCRSNPDGAF
jgi:hypothetical protein